MENTENSTTDEMEESKTDNLRNPTFKKPILIGKVGRLPRKTTLVSNNSSLENVSETVLLVNIDKTSEIVIETSENEIQTEQSSSNEEQTLQESSAPVTDQPLKEQNISLSYKEPSWSGLPNSEIDYSFEVLKSGVIIEKINLMKKSFWIFGRLPTCDVSMAHPTISRYHAVLQYKAVETPERPIGFYIYDLGSTHGTFLNKNRIKPKMYVRIQVGHMLKLGCSTRTYLLNGPDVDTETESDLSLTELKTKRADELKQREEQELLAAQKLEEQRKKEEERGVDWGMGEDADEETDLAENPYAQTNNEELYLDDPKKALRGFMEREGSELHYEVSEHGMGQFLCSVQLPIDDSRGKPIVAEALVKGKKKEAVVQCALEACRILDRHGVLRQAIHESKKRKAKNWEENDYYDSDEDTFLDRTGTIERKRERRMKANQPQQPETYQSLVAKEEKLNEQIRLLEKQIADFTRPDKSQNSEDDEDVDSLDHFMNELSSNKPDKYTIGKLKTDLARLKKEHAETIRLVNIVRPAHLPPLVTQSTSGCQDGASTSGTKTTPNKLPIYGKRLKVKVMLPAREISETSTSQQQAAANSDEEEREEENDEPQTENGQETEPEVPAAEARKGIMDQLQIKMSICDEKTLTSLDNSVKVKISKTVTKLRKIAEEEERIVVDEKRLAVQKKKIYEQLNKADSSDIEKHMKLTNALKRMTNEFCTIGDRKLKIVDKINKLADDINNIATEIRSVSKVQHENNVNRMKEFVEQAHKQQTEIFLELEKLENPFTNEDVLNQLKELYSWLTEQKLIMLENLEKLKDVKLNKDSKLIKDILEFEKKSNNFVTLILDEIHKIREHDTDSENDDEESPKKKLKANDEEIPGVSTTDSETRRTDNLKDKKTETEKLKQFDDENEDNMDEIEGGESSTDTERRKKKNLRRIQQRMDKAEAEKKKQYEEDARKEDYSMWVPPEGQTGDGRTNLNEKFGY